MPFKVSFVDQDRWLFSIAMARPAEISYTTAQFGPTSDELIVRGANEFLNFDGCG